MIRKTIWFYYFLSAASSIAIAFPLSVYVIFLMSNDLNLFEVNLVNFSYLIIVALFEIPTGAFSDLFGRKFSCATSFFLTGIGLLVYGISNSFLEFTIAEIILGVGYTFLSGANKAWLIDRVKHYECSEDIFLEVFSKEKQISQISLIIGVIFGAIVAEKNMVLLWFFGGTLMLVVGFIIVVFMKEEYFVKKDIQVKMIFGQISEITKTSVKYCFRHRTIKRILIVVFMASFCFQGPNMYWQPMFYGFTGSKISLGFIFVGISLFLIIGNKLSVWVVKILGNEKLSLVLPNVITGMFILIAGLSVGFITTLSTFLLHEITRGTYYPIRVNYLNKNIKSSNERATINSLESLAEKLGGAFGLLFSGLIAQTISISMSWILSGGILMISMIILSFKTGED